MEELECVACGAVFRDTPDADGITFDPKERLIRICQECCRKIAKRYLDRWGL